MGDRRSTKEFTDQLLASAFPALPAAEVHLQVCNLQLEVQQLKRDNLAMMRRIQQLEKTCEMQRAALLQKQLDDYRFANNLELHVHTWKNMLAQQIVSPGPFAAFPVPPAPLTLSEVQIPAPTQVQPHPKRS